MANDRPSLNDQSPGRRHVVALLSLLVASVALNVALAYKVREFASIQDAQLAKLAERRLKPGTVVPPIRARHVDSAEGSYETIRYDTTDRPTVLYVVSPLCHWCTKNEASIRQLIVERGGEFRFIALSLSADGLVEYSAKHGLGVPFYSGISEETRSAYKMGGTPQTIVVSPEGIVVANWHGAYLSRQRNEVEKFFKVRLPEIKREKPAA